MEIEEEALRKRSCATSWHYKFGLDNRYQYNWAMIQMNLGNVLKYLISGDRRRNIDETISCYNGNTSEDEPRVDATKMGEDSEIHWQWL